MTPNVIIAESKNNCLDENLFRKMKQLSSSISAVCQIPITILIFPLSYNISIIISYYTLSYSHRRYIIYNVEIIEPHGIQIVFIYLILMNNVSVRCC